MNEKKLKELDEKLSVALAEKARITAKANELKKEYNSINKHISDLQTLKNHYSQGTLF